MYISLLLAIFIEFTNFFTQLINSECVTILSSKPLKITNIIYNCLIDIIINYNMNIT